MIFSSSMRTNIYRFISKTSKSQYDVMYLTIGQHVLKLLKHEGKETKVNSAGDEQRSGLIERFESRSSQRLIKE